VRNMLGSGDQFWMCPECPADENWTHAPEDYLIFEVLDPVTKEPVPEEETGVLHVTNLWMESFPFIRYDMEDVVTWKGGRCPCGRTSKRLRMRGRLAWSVRVGQRYVFSQDVEEVLWRREELRAPQYQLVRRHPQPQDALEVRVAADLGPGTAEELGRVLSEALDVPCTVTAVSPQAVTVKGWKVERVVDA
jgi:phenylacetate-CoA ligase